MKIAKKLLLKIIKEESAKVLMEQAGFDVFTEQGAMAFWEQIFPEVFSRKDLEGRFFTHSDPDERKLVKITKPNERVMRIHFYGALRRTDELAAALKKNSALKGLSKIQIEKLTSALRALALDLTDLAGRWHPPWHEVTGARYERDPATGKRITVSSTIKGPRPPSGYDAMGMPISRKDVQVRAKKFFNTIKYGLALRGGMALSDPADKRGSLSIAKEKGGLSVVDKEDVKTAIADAGKPGSGGWKSRLSGAFRKLGGPLLGIAGIGALWNECEGDLECLAINMMTLVPVKVVKDEDIMDVEPTGRFDVSIEKASTGKGSGASDSW